MENSQAISALVRELQRALQHLYDPTALRKSLLLRLFALEKHRNPALALQQFLTGAIQALRPDARTPLHSPAWHAYQVLTYCYLEQSSQPTVAANMGLSARQVRRLLRVAENLLANHLWTRYDLGAKADLLKEAASSSLPTEDASDELPGRQQELEWLRESLPNETAAIGAVAGGALQIVGPLLEAAGVQVVCELSEGLPPVTGQLAALRQALMNMLTWVVQSAPGGRLRLTAAREGGGIRLQVQAEGHSGAQFTLNRADERLEMAQQFIALFGGTLEVPTVRAGGTLVTALWLPVIEQVPVLVVDDNADTLRLLGRYLSGTRYRFIGARDADQALAMAEEFAPRIILLDVMMPGVHDWEPLGRLREHPATRSVPIIVCTILPQEQLALALGAAGFVRKPVSREALLAALDRQASSPKRECP